MPSVTGLPSSTDLASKIVVREKKEDGTPLYPDYMRKWTSVPHV